MSDPGSGIPGHYRVRALEQALAILDLLAERPDLSLPEIAAAIGVQTPNAHKLVVHLQEAGYVEAGAISRRYRLGTRRLAELAARALSSRNPWEPFRESVPRLAEVKGMQGLVAVLAGGRAVYAEQFRGPARALGRAFPAHATALGKALLAEAPPALVDELVLDAWSERTIVDRKALAAELEVTRRRGWALEDGELDPPRRSIGAVVRDRTGAAVAAIGIGSFAERLPDRRLAGLAESVVAEARRVSETVGGGPLAELPPPRLEVEVMAAVEPPMPPVTSDTAGSRPASRSRAR